MIVSIAVSMLMFAAAAYVGIEAGAWFAERSQQQRESSRHDAILQVALITATATIGAMLMSREVAIPQIATVGFVCACLCAAWWSDVRSGIVPPILVALPLALLLVLAGLRHEWGLLGAAAVVAAPFGIVAWASKGRGVGRSDVLVAALGGALLGLQLAIVAFAVACFALFAVNLATNRRGVAVAATPYMAASIVGCVLVQVMLP